MPLYFCKETKTFLTRGKRLYWKMILSVIKVVGIQRYSFLIIVHPGNCFGVNKHILGLRCEDNTIVHTILAVVVSEVGVLTSPDSSMRYPPTVNRVRLGSSF